MRKFSISLFPGVYETARTTLNHFVNQELQARVSTSTQQPFGVQGQKGELGIDGRRVEKSTLNPGQGPQTIQKNSGKKS